MSAARRYRRGLLLAAAALIVAGAPLRAEAPEVAVRPEARIIEAPGRPSARPVAAEVAEAVDAEPEAQAPGEVVERPDEAPTAEPEVAAPEAPALAPAEPASPSVAAEDHRQPDLPRLDAPPSRLVASELALDDWLALPPGTAEIAEMAYANLGEIEQLPIIGEPPPRPILRLKARPLVRVAAGPPPARPQARPPQPERPFFFDEARYPNEYGAVPNPDMPEISELAAAKAFRPPERPEGITRAAEARAAARARGAVCGNPEIQGTALGNVPGPGSCGVEGGVRVTSVGGVRLSTPSTMDCRTAEALLRWVERGARPAVGDLGGGLASIRVIGHYSCRTRNNAAGARLSEHAFGRAIDISGFELRNGNGFTLINGWNSSAHSQRLRQMHSAACGIFGTVLGPNANAAHRDHFHFDTARYRSGSYCR